MKLLIKKAAPNGNIATEEFMAGLLELRNTPGPSNVSPAQLLFGHPLRSLVPALPESLNPQQDQLIDQHNCQSTHHQEEVTKRYNTSAKPLSSLAVGMEEFIHNARSKEWDISGTIVGIGKHRTFRVRLPNSHIYWRNWRYLRPQLEEVNDDAND